MGFFQRKKTILIVEDELDIAEGLKARLALESFQVELPYNGQDGVAAARKIKPDLIIMDVMMPVVNGLDACAVLKSDADTKHIPILMLTALPHMKDVENAFEVGANDFLNKPYSNERLLKKIELLLSKKHE
jgi:DNA-binding response OmpR family regulator